MLKRKHIKIVLPLLVALLVIITPIIVNSSKENSNNENSNKKNREIEVLDSTSKNGNSEVSTIASEIIDLNDSEIDLEIGKLKKFPIPEESEKEVIDTSSWKDNDFLYEKTKYSVTPGYVSMTAFADSDMIFPGALIKGDTIIDDEYTQIIVDRDPIVISTSMLGGKKDTIKVSVENPKLSSVRQAISDLLSQNKLKGSSNLILDIFEVDSVEELQIMAGFGVHKFNIKAGFDFDVNNYRETSFTAIKFIQEYYTMDIDTPEKPSDLLGRIEDFKVMGGYVPTYISSVTYGRMGIFLIESDYSSSEVKAELETSLKGLSLLELLGLPRLNSESSKIFESANITAYITGGSGVDSVKAVNGFEGFREYVLKGGDYSKDSQGVPISYKLKYLDDNSEVKVAIEKEYEVIDRTPLEKEIEYFVYLEYIDAFNSNEAIFELTDLNIKYGESLPFIEQEKKIKVEKGIVKSYSTDYIAKNDLLEILNEYTDEDYEKVQKYFDKMIESGDIEKYLDKIIPKDEVSICKESILDSLISLHEEFPNDSDVNYLFLDDELLVNSSGFTTFINSPGEHDIIDINIRLLEDDLIRGKDVYESNILEKINGSDIQEGISTFKIKAYKQNEDNSKIDYIEFNFIVQKVIRNVE